MISVDISAIEELKEVIKKASTDSEETLALLKRTLAEMQDDLELQTYVQATSSEEAVIEAVNTLTRINERISALKNILLSLDEEYGNIEYENINAIERMAAYFNNPQTKKMDAEGL